MCRIHQRSMQKVGLKPSPPSKFSRDHAKGQVFLNLCDYTYNLHQNNSMTMMPKFYWASWFMKSRWAALFAIQTLQHLSHTEQPKYQTWMEFHAVIVDEFCLKNEVQLSFTKLDVGIYSPLLVSKSCGLSRD